MKTNTNTNTKGGTFTVENIAARTTLAAMLRDIVSEDNFVPRRDTELRTSNTIKYTPQPE